MVRPPKSRSPKPAYAWLIHRTNTPPPLSEEFIRDHAGDFHGPASEHARDFPDGRVGSHSELANIEHGEALIAAAASDLISEFTSWFSGSIKKNT
ncbi:MAG: hypothetical protein CM1200mP18_20070 [Gammaproteobacteria bacterium]|nr:MAG: hypothetical protein CM1200mP18_20070 [Gammaproteobacteria bacterium]